MDKATKSGIPWIILWKTEKTDRYSALMLEKKLKNLSSERLREFINRHNDGVASPDVPL